MKSKLSNTVMSIFDKMKFGKEEKPLSNKALLEQMVAHFTSQLQERSVNKRMLYPMMFYIFVHPEDWEKRKDDLQFIITEIIDEFYNVIDQYRSKHPNYTSPATEWYFQFSELTDDNVVTDGGEQIVLHQRGKVYIMSRLLAPNIYGNSETQEQDVKFSLSTNKNSKYDTTVNINMAAIAKIDKHGDGVITRKFDMSLNGKVAKDKYPVILPGDSNQQISPTPQPPTPGRNYPELSWQIGALITRFTLRSDYVILSNINDPMSGPNVKKIDNPSVENRHLVIKYDSDKKRYLVAAFAPTILNQKSMTVSTESSPTFYPLSNKSRLILNQEFVLNFAFNPGYIEL